MGVTLAHFQSGGKIPLVSDLLNKIDSGTEIDSLTDLIVDMGQPSGPGDLLFCKAMSLLKTTVGVISMESVRKGELVESTAGIEVVSSQVNTVEKYSLKRVAISVLEHTVDPSEESNSVTLGRIFVLELIYCQNALGLDFTPSTNCFS